MYKFCTGSVPDWSLGGECDPRRDSPLESRVEWTGRPNSELDQMEGRYGVFLVQTNTKKFLPENPTIKDKIFLLFSGNILDP